MNKKIIVKSEKELDEKVGEYKARGYEARFSSNVYATMVYTNAFGYGYVVNIEVVK